MRAKQLILWFLGLAVFMCTSLDAFGWCEVPIVYFDIWPSPCYDDDTYYIRYNEEITIDAVPGPDDRSYDPDCSSCEDCDEELCPEPERELINGLQTFTWRFGDGTTENEECEFQNDGCFDGRTTHKYTSTGAKTLRVQVWDGDSTCDNGCPWGDQDKSATKAIIVVRADIDMQGLGEDDEESKGAFIALNDDDDDDNHTKDLDETGITGEDNVIAASLSAAGAPAVDGKVELLISAGTGNIKVWDSDTKDNQILPRGTPVKYYKTWDISSFPSTVYVEGIGASSVRGAELKWSYIKVLDNDVNCTVHTDKVKITVVDVVSIAVDTSDTKTHKIESVLAEAQIPDDHFVTAEGTGDITLKATISPSTDETKNVITWTGMTQDATDKLKATKSRATSDKYPGTVNVSGKTARSFTNWVVWSSASPTANAVNETVYANRTKVSGGYNVTHTISPPDIMTENDKPKLTGPNTVDAHDVPSGDTGVANKGVSLAGGANKKWDSSRQIKRKVINPDSIVFNPALHDITKYTSYLNYPTDVVCGNDDKGISDEDNNPYSAPYAGAVWGYDNPSRTPYNSEGNVNNTFEIRNHMCAFARLELGGTWYEISDPYLWKTHFKFKKQNESEATWGLDFNNDGDTSDTVPIWRDDNSFIGLDNGGF